MNENEQIEPPDEAELREAAQRLGHPALPEVVLELSGVTARGRDLAILAAEGGGVEVLYALAAAGRCAPDSPEVQALVLCPTPERASRVARALHLLGGPRGLASLAWSPWRSAEGEERPFAQLVAGRPEELLPRVRAARLGLADLRLVAVDGIGALESTGQWESAEAILDTLPEDVQKVVVDDAPGERFQALLKHRLGRARKWPPELLGPAAGPAEVGPPLVWATGAAEEERLERLGDMLRELADETDATRAVVRCHDGETAHRVAAGLASSGFDLTHEADEPGVVVAWGEDEPPPEEIGVFFGLPLSLEQLRWLEGARARGAVVATGEETQLGLTARRAGWPGRALPAGPDTSAEDELRRYRERVRRRIGEGDDAAEALVLEPLLRAHGAVPVARALSALLREGGPETPAEEPPARRTPTPLEEARGRPAPRHPSVGGTWTRLFVNVGERDGAGPGDLVGAITGETSLTGDQIGRIDVRENYSLVDVAAESAEEVIQRLTGVRIKGREVVARPDRTSS